jgi:2'-5' RNA ligase
MHTSDFPSDSIQFAEIDPDDFIAHWTLGRIRGRHHKFAAAIPSRNKPRWSSRGQTATA